MADEWFQERRAVPTPVMPLVRQTLGDIYLRMGRGAEAVRYHSDAVAMQGEMRETHDLADAHRVGRGSGGAGDRATVHKFLTEALSIFEELGTSTPMACGIFLYR